MKKEGLDQRVIEKLNLETTEPNLDNWMGFVEAVINPSKEITIALVGKYVEHHDSYKSIVEAFIHGGAVNDCKVKVRWVQSDNLTDDNVATELESVSGILVAPGFGGRGIDGKLAAVNLPEQITYPSLEFAWVCSVQLSNLQEMPADGKLPIVPSLIRIQNIQLLI